MSWHLDPDLPAANACCAAVANVDGEAALSLMPDPRASAEALWFHVRLRRLEADAPTPWLQLTNPQTLFGAGDGSGLRPAIRCDAGGWRRLPGGRTTTLADGRR